MDLRLMKMEYSLIQITYIIIDADNNRWRVGYTPYETKWKCIVIKNQLPVLTDFITINNPSFELTKEIVAFAINGNESIKH